MKEYKVWHSRNGYISYTFTKSLEIAQRKARDLIRYWGDTVTVKITRYNPATNRYDLEVSA